MNQKKWNIIRKFGERIRLTEKSAIRLAAVLFFSLLVITGGILLRPVEALAALNITRVAVPVNGTWVSRTISSRDDRIFMDLFLPSDGLLTITTQSYRSNSSFILQNGDQTSTYQDFGLGGSADKPGSSVKEIWLKSGEYHYIARDNTNSIFTFYPGDYRVKFEFQSAGCTDEEPNDTFEQATLLNKGRIVRGAILEKDDRIDYFKLTPTPNSGSNVVFHITSYSSNLGFGIYDSSYNCVKFVEVPKGTFSRPKNLEVTLDNPKGSLYYVRFGDYYAVGSSWQRVFTGIGAYTLQWTQECSHIYGAGVITNPGKYRHDGLITYTCSLCGSEKHEAIPELTTVELSETSYTYNGKVRTPSIVVKDRTGKSIGKDQYSVTYPSGRKAAGTYQVKIKFKGRYEGEGILSFKITPATQEIKGVSSRTFGLKYIRKSKRTFTLKPKAKTAISYSTSSKYIKVSKKGKVTISKATPRGTYKIRITAKKSPNYKETTKTITIKIQ